jgi:hypothetical protein
MALIGNVTNQMSQNMRGLPRRSHVGEIKREPVDGRVNAQRPGSSNMLITLICFGGVQESRRESDREGTIRSATDIDLSSVPADYLAILRTHHSESRSLVEGKTPRMQFHLKQHKSALNTEKGLPSTVHIL